LDWQQVAMATCRSNSSIEWPSAIVAAAAAVDSLLALQFILGITIR